MTTAIPVNQRGSFGQRQFTRVINEQVKACSLQGCGSYSVLRGPNDPIFSATLTLSNLVPGSRYRVTRHSTGAQLATGVAATSEVVLYALPVHEPNMRVDIVVRNASGSVKYKPFETAAVMAEAGASAYIAQQLD